MRDVENAAPYILHFLWEGLMELTISGLKKSYRGQAVLQNIELTAHSGQCVAILGTNGTGKSTLLSILAGVQSRDAGSFILDGHDLFQAPAMRSRLVGYVPQGTPLIPELTARDNLLLWYSRDELEKELDGGILAWLGIGDFISKRVSRLSGGMKKRLSIGCAMANRPPVLLLDEPTAALDLICKQDIAKYLAAYCQSGGIVLLTTHSESELKLCHCHYILKNGCLSPYQFDGDMQRLTESL